MKIVPGRNETEMHLQMETLMMSPLIKSSKMSVMQKRVFWIQMW